MKRTIILISVLIIISFVLNAQEVLIDCGNQQLKNYSEKYYAVISNRHTKAIDTLDLPFFDDFSKSFIYPDSTKWIDKFAYINKDYAVNPISMGAASLDAIDNFGAVYTHLPSLSSSIADYLTSAPINLGLSVADSLYLSFYYQAGGNGNSPEVRDSLVLQFKSPSTDWKSVWNAPGGEAMDTFKLALIPIIDPTYLVKGFQFRLLNYASISSNYEPSWVSNTDIWNIDFVKLDKNRSWDDTLANDVAFIKDFGSKLIGWEAVPWNHFKDYTGNIVNDSITFTYKSTYGVDVMNVNRRVIITDIYGDTPTYSMLEDNENIEPLQTIEYTRAIPYNFTSNTEDSARFLLKGYLKIDGAEDLSIYRWNDTSYYYQDFNNYYAYDDGSAERGYGISGQGTAYSSLACKFTPLKADILKGVYIYFNQTLNEANRKYFYLTIWSDNDGIPGDTIFQKIGVKPYYSDQTNGFLYYSLDTSIYIDTTFYIGWIKTTDDMLNCGYDLNNDAGSKVFYNVSGEWQASAYNGAMMIRPVFGYAKSRAVYKPEIVKSEYDIYPNPASDYVKILSEIPPKFVAIYDATGRLVRQFNGREDVFVGDLEQGTYFIRPVSEASSFKTKKILILR
ncbi:MAG: T9SS type A sorting domain-containing protein [Bacteroidales bacterium]|nr:T9SS type A sorting domain-containing protein [Bacteroidales bacterium]MDD4215836.1 T9SS type A sorting domain-containing protein [Bacteroidales bacterium]